MTIDDAMDADAWRAEAACFEKNTDIFYSSDYVRAKRVCSTCSVVRECLAEALRYEKLLGRRDGVWGNTTPEERYLIDGDLPYIPIQ